MPKKGKRKLADGPPQINPEGTIIEATKKDSFRIGKKIGEGGFGLIHQASSTSDKASSQPQYVVKIERSGSLGLYSEYGCMNHSKLTGWCTAEQKAWAKAQKLKHFPLAIFNHCLQMNIQKVHCRVMVMPRYGLSIAAAMKAAGNEHGVLTTPTVYAMVGQLLAALQYLHEQGYTHADVKADNICLDANNNTDIYLLDFGCAEKYETYTTHKPYAEDPTLRHEGTLVYSAIDMHKGAPCSRRGDLEILAYQTVEWLGELPWMAACRAITDANKPIEAPKVQASKQHYCKRLSGAGEPAAKAKAGAQTLLADSGLDGLDEPAPVMALLTTAFSLEYTEKPDYSKLKKAFAHHKGVQLEFIAAGDSKISIIEDQDDDSMDQLADELIELDTEDDDSVSAAAKSSSRGRRQAKRGSNTRSGPASKGGKPPKRNTSRDALVQSAATTETESPRTARLRRRHERLQAQGL
eukprot:TRINITY_DN8055_c0_g1_i2.p1 TRINITY_DN8055_c0_g1~~TRINITY_DN8055_c0_g1_i2.p1  ORF type:complete len:465 (+),score=121.83 TRINITY_DN8055_c0_g1_i2:22-1416(+)